jgi:hypothetical protein
MELTSNIAKSTSVFDYDFRYNWSVTVLDIT